MNHVWRACALLALDNGQPWWPLGGPVLTSVVRPEDMPFSETGRIEPTTATFLTRPSWASADSSSAALPESCKVEAGQWLDAAWGQLDGARSLEEPARSFLTALRLLSFGHLYVEPAFMTLVAIFDALGAGPGNRARIKDAMLRSYGRHYCPDLRTRAAEASKLLFDLTYGPARNPLTHEAGLLHLDGHGSGPVGDRPRDLDSTAVRMDFGVVRALVVQVRYLLRGELGAPGPEPGRCIHSE